MVRIDGNEYFLCDQCFEGGEEGIRASLEEYASRLEWLLLSTRELAKEEWKVPDPPSLKALRNEQAAEMERQFNQRNEHELIDVHGNVGDKRIWCNGDGGGCMGDCGGKFHDSEWPAGDEAVTGANPETSDPNRLWWVVAIAPPTACPFEVSVPWGYTLTDWQVYAKRWYGPGCAVRPLDPFPKGGPDTQIATSVAFRPEMPLRPGVFVRRPPPSDTSDDTDMPF